MSENKEDDLLKLINKLNLSPDEVEKVIKNFKQINPQKYQTTKIDFPDNHVKFGVFSDAHMGHSCYRPDIFRKMIKDGKRQSLEFFLNAGDTIEGMSGRDGHIYELTHLGASQQLDYFEKEFSRLDRQVYSIEAQDSHGGWFKSKGNMGLDIGEELERRCKNYKFIGYDEQDIELDNGCKIRLRHPGGGTAYAISYKIQKYVEAMSGGKKPNLLFDGHFHKAMYMFHRNVHCFESGTLQEQSPFMKKIGTPAHLGYWMVDVNMHKKKGKGVERVTSQFMPFYE